MIYKQYVGPVFVHKYPLNDDERRQIKRISTSLTRTARILRVSDETVRALLDPLGGVKQDTLIRVRERLAALSGKEKPPTPCDAGGNREPQTSVF